MVPKRQPSRLRVVKGEGGEIMEMQRTDFFLEKRDLGGGRNR